MVCYSWFPLSLFLLLALRIREYDLLWAEAVEFVSKMTLIIPLALGILIYEVAIIQGFCVIPGVTAVMVNDLGFLWAGLDDQCGNDGVTEFTKALRDLSGAEGRCLSIGNGRIDSWLLRIDKQAAMVCNKIKSIPSLRNGYNIVGLSQGNMVARAVIEWCHGGPPVHNYISLGGPHAGIAAIPYCTFLPLCRFLNEGIAPLIYSPIVQSNFAPSGYFKIPSELSTYYKRAYLLPRINNEIPHVQNKSFKKRFQQLNHLVLIQFDEDLVLVPPQSAWFQYYPDNDVTLCEVLPLNESALYKEDWIGLRSLNEEGKVSFISLPSDHLSISSHQMEKYIVPYINQTSDFGSEWVLNQPRQPNNGNPISWYTNGTQVLMVSKS